LKLTGTVSKEREEIKNNIIKKNRYLYEIKKIFIHFGFTKYTQNLFFKQSYGDYILTRSFFQKIFEILNVFRKFLYTLKRINKFEEKFEGFKNFRYIKTFTST